MGRGSGARDLSRDKSGRLPAVLFCDGVRTGRGGGRKSRPPLPCTSRSLSSICPTSCGKIAPTGHHRANLLAYNRLELEWPLVSGNAPRSSADLRRRKSAHTAPILDMCLLPNRR